MSNESRERAGVAAKLTCGRTRCVWSTLHHFILLNPSLDLLRVHWYVSHFKSELTFVRFNKFPPLALPHDRRHLLRLDILVLPPLADA